MDFQYYLEFQEKERHKDLPEYCIKTLDRIKKNAKTLKNQKVGSNNYNKTLHKLIGSKEKYERQLQNLHY